MTNKIKTGYKNRDITRNEADVKEVVGLRAQRVYIKARLGYGGG